MVLIMELLNGTKKDVLLYLVLVTMLLMLRLLLLIILTRNGGAVMVGYLNIQENPQTQMLMGCNHGHMKKVMDLQKMPKII